MSQYETRTLALIVNLPTESVLSETATIIRIEDEAGGEFLEIEQFHIGKIRIGPDEWPTIRDAVNTLMAQCRGDTP